MELSSPYLTTFYTIMECGEAECPCPNRNESCGFLFTLDIFTMKDA